MDSSKLNVARCPVCLGGEFASFRGRDAAQCVKCGSLERHRVMYVGIERWIAARTSGGRTAAPRRIRVLHLAPERCFARALSAHAFVDYVAADISPSRYPWTQCLSLAFPEGYRIFPDSYFDVIVHNHVLEHIPGHWKDHLLEFQRLLAPKGIMFFSVPGPSRKAITLEGGEHLASDSERKALFGQEDHVRRFGSDLEEHLVGVPNMELKVGLFKGIDWGSYNTNFKKHVVFAWSKL